MSYYRFPINLWMQYVTRCMPVPSNHSNVRIQGLHERVYKCARSTPVGSILELLKPFFDFVDEAVDSGRSVLVEKKQQACAMLAMKIPGGRNELPERTA